MEALPAQAERPVHSAPPAKASADRLGLVVGDLTPQQRERQDVKRGGAVVKLVAGAALEAGLQPGDIILSVNSEDIDDSADFKRMVQRLPANQVARLLVQRGDNPQWLALRVPK